MTDEHLNELKQMQSEIERLDGIIHSMKKVWKRGWLTVNKRPIKFHTGYGEVYDRIDLEADEFDALMAYLKNKKERLQDALSKE